MNSSAYAVPRPAFPGEALRLDFPAMARPKRQSAENPPAAKRLSPEAQADIFREVARVLNAVRPMIQADGGDVELVDLTPQGVVRIRWMGACVGCPSSEMTLREGIENNLRQHVPAVTGVEAVE